jgi:hypothetical protein
LPLCCIAPPCCPLRLLARSRCCRLRRPPQAMVGFFCPIHRRRLASPTPPCCICRSISSQAGRRSTVSHGGAVVGCRAGCGQGR